MNEVFKTTTNDCITFSDTGITLDYIWEDKVIRRYYPYGSIMKVSASGLLGTIFSITGKDTAPNGKNFLNTFQLMLSMQNKNRIKKAVGFATNEMRVAPLEHMNETVLEKGTAHSEKEKQLREYAKWCETRVKWRNRGLSILLISAFMVLYACFANGGAFFGIAGALGIVVGLMMFGSHLEPSGKIREPKDKSGTKEIVKGAVIGSIVAGETGAIVGATIAKNKLDNQK